MAGSSSDLIQLRMKLVGNKLVVSGTDQVSKSIKGLGKATTQTSAKQRYAERTNSRLTTSYKKLGTAAKWGLGFLGVGGVLAIQSSIHASEELGKTTSALTRNFGLQNNVASRWAAVAQGREIDSKALSMTFGTLSSKMVEAGRKGGTALTPFHQLGISQEEATKGANNFQWGLLRVAKALGDEEGGAKRATAAKAILGKGYATLLPLFSEGTKGLKEQLHWADKYGVTLSGSTTDGLMEMVQAQRENKVAMLGLQLSLTKALMPAIKAGDEELQKFIATLNSPNLTADQKVARISHQFLALEDDIVKVIERALPSVAEHAGQLGVKMAGAVVHGFIHSNIVGKLAISAWLFHALGGEALIKAGAMRVGGMIGTTMGIGLAMGAVGAFVGYEIYEHMSERTKMSIRRWGADAGETFVNFLIDGINVGIREINDALDAANALSVFGVDAPNIGEVGHVNFGGEQRQYNEEAKITREEGLVSGPGGQPIPAQRFPHGTHPGDIKPKHNRHRGSSPRVANAPRRRDLMLAPAGGHTGTGGARTLVLHTHFHADGRELAELVTEHALDSEALK